MTSQRPDDIIISTYGSQKTNDVPAAAVAITGGATVDDARFGQGTQVAPQIEEAIAARERLSKQPKMRDSQ